MKLFTTFTFLSLALFMAASLQSQIIIEKDQFLIGANSVPTNGGLFQPIMFYYDKNNEGAFRCGYVTANAWDVDSLGRGSIAGGLNTTANKSGSASFGQNVNSPSFNSFTMGHNITKNGFNSWVTGRSNELYNSNSLVHGRDNDTDFQLFTGELFLFGNNNRTNGVSSFVQGISSRGSNNGIMFGNSNVAADGVNFASAFGIGHILTDNRQFVVGKFNEDPTTSGISPFGYHLLIVGNGTGGGAFRSNALVVTRDNQVGIGTNNPCETLQVMGNISFGNEIVNSSDRRLKKNIRKIKSVSEALSNIKAVTYNYDTQAFKEYKFSDKLQIGVLAQDIERYFPELVTEDTKGYKHVDYTRLAVVLLKGIQEASDRNKDLTQNVQKLKDKYALIIK